MFLRAGAEAYRFRRWFDAFVHFYLYLEGMYGGGKYSNDAVAHHFRLSPKVRRAAEQAVTNFHARNGAADVDALTRLLQRYGQTDDLDGIIGLLVALRGAFFHFSVRSPRATPRSRPYDFLVPAYLAMTIATFCAVLEIQERAVTPLE